MPFKVSLYGCALIALLSPGCTTYHIQDFHATLLNPNSTPVPAIERKPGDFRFSAGIAGKPYSREYSYHGEPFQDEVFSIQGFEYPNTYSPINIHLKTIKIQGSFILDKTFSEHFFAYLNGNTDGNCISIATGCGYHNTFNTPSEVLSTIALQLFGFQTISSIDSRADIYARRSQIGDPIIHESNKATSDMGFGLQLFRESNFPIIPSLGLGLIAERLNLHFSNPEVSLAVLVPSIFLIQKIGSKNQLSLSINYFYSTEMSWPYVQFGWSVCSNTRK